MADFNRQEIHQDFDEFFPVQADVGKRSIKIPAAKMLAALATMAVTAALVFNTYVDCFATQIWHNSALLDVNVLNRQEYRTIDWQLTEEDGDIVRQGQLDIHQQTLQIENLTPGTGYSITFTTQAEDETKIIGNYRFTTGSPPAAAPAPVGTPAPAVTPTPVVTSTPAPTVEPTATPTATPVSTATPSPTQRSVIVPPAPVVTATPAPTAVPTVRPTVRPSTEPTTEPTVEPTAEPTVEPTAEPSPEPTAEPTPVSYAVSVTAAGGGTVSANPETATAGTQVTLTATADSGYRFAEWQQTAGPTVTITDNVFTMPEGDVEFTAVFEEILYTVTVTSQGDGTVSANPVSAPAGTLVTLTATPIENNIFVQWQQTSGTTVQITDNTFTMPESDVAFTGMFEYVPQRPQAMETVVNDITVEELAPEITTPPTAEVDVDFVFRLNDAQLVDITVEHAIYNTYDNSVITQYDDIQTTPVTDADMVASANHTFTITEGMADYYRYVATPLLTYTMPDGLQYTLTGNRFTFQTATFNNADYSSSSVTYSISDNPDGTKQLDYTVTVGSEDIMGNADNLRITALSVYFDRTEIEVPAADFPLAPGVMIYSGSILLTDDMLATDTHILDVTVTGHSYVTLSDGTVKDLGNESMLYLYNDEVRTNTGGYTLTASLPANNPESDGISISDVQISVNGNNYSDSLSNVVLSPDTPTAVSLRYTIGSSTDTWPDAYYYPQVAPANGATDFYCNVTPDAPYYIEETKFDVSFTLPAITAAEGATIDLSQYVDYTGINLVYNRYIVTSGTFVSDDYSWKDEYYLRGETFTLSDHITGGDIREGSEYTVTILQTVLDQNGNEVDTLRAEYNTTATRGVSGPQLEITYTESPVEQCNKEIYITYRLVS
ncbi:MAG: InlB B-repeat-containing protein [Oscillospiraceae bacterium]|nr:InlB B-repeat-containing protein [Oscillospiraceae bacterium]